jgi:hypothetical protein
MNKSGRKYITLVARELYSHATGFDVLFLGWDLEQKNTVSTNKCEGDFCITTEDIHHNHLLIEDRQKNYEIIQANTNPAINIFRWFIPNAIPRVFLN